MPRKKSKKAKLAEARLGLARERRATFHQAMLSDPQVGGQKARLARNERAGKRFEKLVERIGARMQKKVFPSATKAQEEVGLRGDRGRFNVKTFKTTPDSFFRGIQEEMSRRMDDSMRAFDDPFNTSEGFFKSEARSPQGRQRLANMVRRISKGLPVDIPSLMVDVTGKARSHEGRHRMAVAKKLGIPHVPVAFNLRSQGGGELFFGKAGENPVSKMKEAIFKQNKRVPSALSQTGTRAGTLSSEVGNTSLAARIFRNAGTARPIAKALGFIAPPVAALMNAQDALAAGEHLKRLKEDAEFRRERDQAMGRLRQPQNQTGVDPRGPGFRSRF